MTKEKLSGFGFLFLFVYLYTFFEVNLSQCKIRKP